MRYTFKKDDKYIWYYDDLLPEDFEINAKNKFGMLEDLEEEIGCPLECMVAVFNAMQQECIYCDIGRGMYELHNFRLDYVDVVDDEESYMGHFKSSEYHYVLDLDDDCLIYVEDYKKTWWLREDKSE